MPRFLLIIFVASLAFVTIQSASVANQKSNYAECDDLPQEIKNDIASYESAVRRIINYFTNGPFKGELYRRLSDFVDKFGHRLSGTQVLEDSIDYMVALSNQENLQNVHKEEVTVPYWNRGNEKLTLLKPRNKNMPMLGLGGSVATPPEGITAKAVVVKSFEELRALNDSEVEGKIVVYDQPFTTYGQTVLYRRIGAVEAAKKGAVAALVRSVTQLSIATPHTGTQEYDDAVTKIPFAAITHEDADYLRREQNRRNEIELTLEMNCTLTDATSYNFVSQVTGSNDKIVIVSGHIDSWDTGDGSMDDAGGSLLSWLAPIAMRNLGLRPKRTVRTVLFTGEEQGLIGAYEYESANRLENANLSFVMESDAGIFRPLGISYEGDEEGNCVLREVLKLFEAIGTTELSFGDAGPDVSVWTRQGIPGGGLRTANDRYFWFHHSDGDTLNVMDPDNLDLASALWTGFAYVMADMQYEIPKINRTVVAE